MENAFGKKSVHCTPESIEVLKFEFQILYIIPSQLV